jgi:hypothetical protein
MILLTKLILHRQPLFFIVTIIIFSKCQQSGGLFDCLKTPYESGQLIDYGMKGAFYRQNTEMKSTGRSLQKRGVKVSPTYLHFNIGHLPEDYYLKEWITLKISMAYYASTELPYDDLNLSNLRSKNRSRFVLFFSNSSRFAKCSCISNRILPVQIVYI